MRVSRYLFVQLAFQLSFLSASALDIGKPIGAHREAIPMIVPDSVSGIPPKAWNLYERGLAAQKRNDLEAALREFQAALKVYPHFVAAFEAQGTTLLWQERLTEAQRAFQKALALNPDGFQAQLGLGLVMNGTGEFQEAIEHLQKALYLNGECWQVRYALGRAYYGLGQHLKAELNLKLAGAWRPKHPNLYLLLALVLLDEGKQTEALAEMETFVDLSPNNPLAREIRAKIEELRGAE